MQFGLSPQDEFGGPDNARSLVLDELLDERRSCRAYRDESVPRETIEQILAMAQKSASWCNTQPWSVIITEGEGTEQFRSALMKHAASAEPAPDLPMPERYSGVYLERRREVGWQLYDSLGIVRGDRTASYEQAMKNFEFFGAPHVALITSDQPQGAYGAIDSGLYVGTFVIAAASVGVATIVQAALAQFGDFVHNYFGIPDDRLLLCGIAFGYADTASPANAFSARRASLDEVVVWRSH